MGEMTPDYLQRFAGVGRVYGAAALPRLAQGHFVVVGLGGVGSWAAEALARTGVGGLTLIELDGVCITNTNRQSHAMAPNYGASKNRIISDRLLSINPELKLHSVEDFLTRDNLVQLIDPGHDVVVDAIDSAHIKAALVAYCRARKIRLITVGASGGKRDPGRIVAGDLGVTTCDPMLKKVRSLLYRHHNFARNQKRRFGVDAIYSTEPMSYPQADGSACGRKQFDGGVKLDCGGGLGALTMVTGSFGFAAAAKAVERYLGDKSNLA